MVNRARQRFTIIVVMSVFMGIFGCAKLNPFSKKSANTVNINIPDPISLTCDYPFSPFKGLLLSRQSSQEESLSEDQFAWYSYPKVRYSLDELNNALDNIVSTMGERRKLILYIHGQTNEPNDAFEQNTLQQLEAQYNAEVLMFQWPAWLGRNTLADDNATKASAYLAQALDQFNRYKQDNAVRMNNLKITLLVQGSGNRVLQGVLENYSGTLAPDLLTNLVLSAPDVPLAGHPDWLNKAEFAKNIYVFSNCNDPFLNLVRKERQQTLLGQQLTVNNKDEITLADNAQYIVIDSASSAHQYLVDGERSAFLSRIFEGIMNDQANPLDNVAVAPARGNQVFKFRTFRAF